MAIRYKRLEETLADVQKASRRSERNANRPTGTEVAQTKDTAIQAAADSTFAKELALELEGVLGPLPGQIQTALNEAATALSEAGLARSDAAAAVSDASQAASDAAQAIQDALAAATLAGGSNTWADRAPVAADADGKPVGAVWFEYDTAGLLAAMWELRPLGWVQRALDETIIPQVAIGTGTYGSLSGDRLVARSILAEHIAALAITANELAANSVVAVKIAADAVTAEKINAGAVTTVKLDALAVTAEKIAVGAIIAEKIAAEAITAEKLAATAIDGMLITGATIRTAASGQRMQFDINGLTAYNAAGTQTLSIQSASDGLVMRGDSDNTISFSSYAGIRYNSNRAASGVGRFILEPRTFSMTKNFDGVGPVMSLTHGVGEDDTVQFRAINAPLGIRADGDVYIDGNGVPGATLTLWHEKIIARTIDGITWRGQLLGVSNKIEFRLGAEGDELVPMIERDGVGGLRIKPGTMSGNPNNITIGNPAQTGIPFEQKVTLQGNELVLNAPKVTFRGRAEFQDDQFVLAQGSSLGTTTITSTATNLAVVSGGAGQTVSVTVATATDVRVELEAGLNCTSLLVIGVEASGATTRTIPRSYTQQGVLYASSSITAFCSHEMTLNPGTTSFRIVAGIMGSSGTRILESTKIRVLRA